MDAISAQRIALLYPELARRWTIIDGLLVNQGVEVRVTAGLRTWAQQDALYAQGRTAPGKIVTYAQGGQSWHQYGVALDFVPMLNGIPQWNTSYPAWAITINLAKQWGLTSGADWPSPKTDIPHLQFTAPYGDTPGNDVQAIYSMQSFAGVWQAMNNYRGIAFTAANPDLYISNPHT
jgi:peptidoglycan L-alanyl-D-glutamate endopeptidase CwlK